MKTEITEFVFNYPTHAVVWTVYCGESQPDLDDYATPDAARGLQVYCDWLPTLASAQERVMKDRKYPERYFAPVEVWHMYEKGSDEHYATHYDGR